MSRQKQGASSKQKGCLILCGWKEHDETRRPGETGEMAIFQHIKLITAKVEDPFLLSGDILSHLKRTYLS